MNRYHLTVIIGGQYAGQFGTAHYTVEADGFEYGTSGVYRFWSRINNKIENIAMYPTDRTIIKKIEKIKEQ